jgi:hypothetical protein
LIILKIQAAKRHFITGRARAEAVTQCGSGTDGSSPDVHHKREFENDTDVVYLSQIYIFNYLDHIQNQKKKYQNFNPEPESKPHQHDVALQH